MYCKQDLLNQLSALGVPQDRPVLVHSALRRVGEVEGRGQTVLDALIEHVSADGGLLCVPTHTWNRMYQAHIYTLDLTAADTCVGTLSKLAILDGRGTRTLNPTHSMAVFGDPDAVADFVKNEEKQMTHTAPDGCYGKIFHADGSILLLGVNHSSNTFMHCVEEMLGVPDRLTKHTIPVSVKYADGRVEHREIYTFEDDPLGDVSKKFPKYEPAFRAHGCIADGFVGDAPTMLCSARGIRDVMALVRERSGGRELLGDDLPLAEEWYRL